MPKKRNYKEEYAKYQSSPAAKKARAARNKARRANKSCAGDVDHKDGNPLNNTKSNTRCISKKKNRADGMRKIPKSAAARGGRKSKPGRRKA